MPVPDGRKPALLLLLLGWPAAALVGLGLSHATQTAWPAGALPAGWFVVLVVVLRQYARRTGD